MKYLGFIVKRFPITMIDRWYMPLYNICMDKREIFNYEKGKFIKDKPLTPEALGDMLAKDFMSPEKRKELEEQGVLPKKDAKENPPN